VETFCSYYNAKKCRSCSEIEIPYEDQIFSKEAHVRQCLEPIKGSPLQLKPTWRSQAINFRCRAKLNVTGNLDNPVIGLTGELEDLDSGTEILDCPIHHPKINAILRAMPDFIRKAKLEPYQIAARTGELKGLILVHSPESGETYLRFILRSQECVARLRKFLPELIQKFSELKCVSANIQPIPHAILEGELEIFLTESISISHRIRGVALRLAPQGFVQTHFEGSSELYATAAEWIARCGAKKMLELFCGQGVFSFIAAKHLEHALGVEINAQAVEMARNTALELNLPQLKFLAADAGRIQSDLIQFHPDLVLVNPPRKGLQRSVELVKTINAKFILYSSCSAESLAKDLTILRSDYQLELAQIFDFFPHTAHYETLVLLEKRAPAPQ